MKNKGFTLIEVLVSALILAVGVLAMVRLFPTAAIINARADRVSQATILAEDKIEEFRSMGYDSLETLITAGEDSGNYTSENITLDWSLTKTENLIQANILCHWLPPGRVVNSEATINFVTQVANHE